MQRRMYNRFYKKSQAVTSWNFSDTSVGARSFCLAHENICRRVLCLSSETQKVKM
uniref:Uncharacterized protein n=1 Tax=Oryza brachyantha TaxID=4533 RepID=J3LMG4_ORYBR